MKAIKYLLLIFLLAFFAPRNLMAQNTDCTNQINIGYDVGLFQDVTFKAINLQYTLFPEKDFSLHYSLGIGSANNMFYTHYPLSGFWGAYILVNSGIVDSDAFLAITILSLIIPESISYNIELNNKMKISPYILFNSQEFYFNEKKEEELKASVGFGSRFSYKVSPHFGFTFTTGMKLLFDIGAGIHTSGSIYFKY